MEAAEAGAGGAFMIRTASSVSIICAHLCVCVCVHLYMRMRGGRGGRGASRPIVRRYDREGHLGAVKLRVGVVCVGNGVCVRVCTNSLRQARRRRPAYHRDCGAACARDAPSWPVQSSERCKLRAAAQQYTPSQCTRTHVLLHACMPSQPLASRQNHEIGSN